MEEIKTLLRMTAKGVLPMQAVETLRARSQKNKRKRAANANVRQEKFSATDLREHLESSGIDRARDIFIHGAFSRVGVDGGPDTLIDVITDFMDPRVTILMPAYPMGGTALEWMASPEPFDVQNSPSKMGALTEVFRKRKGTLRSLHPSHSVCAAGPEAEFYIKDHHTSVFPCGEASPFARLAERNGQIICIGSDVGKVTAYHVAEDVNPNFPVQVRLPRPMTKMVLNNGQSLSVETMVGDPALSPWRVDNFAPKLEEFRGHMKEYGCLKVGRLGYAEMNVIEAKGFLDMLNKLAKTGTTIYHRPRNPVVRKIAGFPF